MAPVGEAYFPPLDRCFSGAQQLWTWELCFNVLSRIDELEHASFQKFLGDPQTHEVLLNPLSPFPQTSAQSKSTFETKTSAINVAQGSNGRYNIQEIKEDALWLSKETKIDEVSALRIAVIEWQTRAASQLLRSGAGDAATNTLRLTHPFKALWRSNASVLNGSLEGHQNGIETGSFLRRRRIAEILLSERRHILKCAEFIFARLLYSAGPAEQSRTKPLDFLVDIGMRLAALWLPDRNRKGKQPASTPSILPEAIKHIQKRLHSLKSGSQWSGLGGEADATEICWGSSQVIEIIHILQIMQVILQACTTPVQGEVILPWFAFMEKEFFFERFQLPYPGLETYYNVPLQCLAALISLSFLNISAVLDLLAKFSHLSSSPTSSTTPYILIPTVVNDLNDHFNNIAQHTGASLSVMAWSIITQNIREIASNTRETRETRQSIRAAEHFGSGDSSDTESYERPLTRTRSALRRQSDSSDTSQQSTLIEDIYDTISRYNMMNDDPIASLANSAVEGGKLFDVMIAVATEYSAVHGFEHQGASDQRMRLVLLDLIQTIVEYVDYQPALIEATLAVVTGGKRYWDIVDQHSSIATASPANLLREEGGVLRQQLFLPALTRFPYELTPLLQICRALADANQGDPIWYNLQALDTLTCKLPHDYQNYQNVREDEEGDFIQLTDDYSYNILNTPGQASKVGLLAYHRGTSNSFQTIVKISRGTEGSVLSNGKPLVVAWNLHYSALSYVGRILYGGATVKLSKEASDSSISYVNVTESIAFVTAMLLSAFKHAYALEATVTAQEYAASILGQASNELGRNDDIVSIVFQIFENQLYEPPKTGSEEENLSLLVECVKFTHAVVRILPDRVWPFLARSGLLAIAEDGGRLNVIISSYEIVTGHYDFLISCTRLFDALIDDVVRNAVLRKTPSKAIARFGEEISFGAGVSQPTMEKVLINFQRTMLDVFGSIENWKFGNPDDQTQIGKSLCSTFNRLITYSYGTNTSAASQLTSTLLPPTRIMLDVLLAPTKTGLTLENLLRIAAQGFDDQASSLPMLSDTYRIQAGLMALDLVRGLLSICAVINKDSSELQNHLFRKMPMFTRLYASRPEYQLPVIRILDSLISVSENANRQSPSLLAHLGQENARSFFDQLSVFDRPVDNIALNVAIWRFFGSVLSMRQPWFSRFILSGKTPSHRVKEESISATESHSVLGLALDQLTHIDKLEPSRALAMLDFVTVAADFWPDSLKAIDDQREFIRNISRHGSSNKMAQNGVDATSEDICRVKIFARIAEMLAMYTHWKQQDSNQTWTERVLEHLHSLEDHVVVVPNYNFSLQGRFRHNFTTRFTTCTLTDFQRSGLKLTSDRDSTYFDYDQAEKMLSFDGWWLGTHGKGNDREMRRVNVNISLVEAQVLVFQSWKNLLYELSVPLAKAAKFQKTIATMVIECLKANSENNLPEIFAQQLVQSRADLAFNLLETLNLGKSKEPEVQKILAVAWNTLRSHNDSLGAALAAEDADYHRLLIRILYLALQLHTFPDASPAATNPQDVSSQSQPKSSTVKSSIPIALEIISTLIAKGFRSLASLLLESPNQVTPSDFSILTAILTTCLQIPNLSRNTDHLMAAFTDTSTPRCAATLLSWSDQLAAATNGDPLYAEVAILFLNELSSVPAIAESLATEAVLSHILDSNIMQALQDRAFGPLDTPGRMYLIWARGLLPLLLNLLYAVGPPIAAEIATALNTFPHQLERASLAFGSSSSRGTVERRDIITLAMAQEAHNLALITTILNTYRNAGASAGIDPVNVAEVKWDRSRVREDVEALLERRGLLRDRVVASDERESRWGDLKGDQEGETRLEAKIVRELRGVRGVLEGAL